jgi:hypothetical protein
LQYGQIGITTNIASVRTIKSTIPNDTSSPCFHQSRIVIAKRHAHSVNQVAIPEVPVQLENVKAIGVIDFLLGSFAAEQRSGHCGLSETS